MARKQSTLRSKGDDSSREDREREGRQHICGPRDWNVFVCASDFMPSSGCGGLRSLCSAVPMFQMLGQALKFHRLVIVGNLSIF